MVLLGSVMVAMVWFLPLGSWPENFLKIAVLIFGVSTAVVTWFWPANSSLRTGYFLAIYLTFVVPFLIAYPFVGQEEAKEKARKYAEEHLHGAKNIKIAEAKLDDWTWIVTGWRIESFGLSVQFCVDVHAKSGTASNLRYTK
jgi:hypothetical protein